MEKKNTTMAEAILSDKEVEHSKPKDKSYFLNDGCSLFLLITPSGAKQWKYKFSFNGKKETLALGGYPKVSLKDARTLRNEARIEKDEDINPVDKKRAAKSAAKSAEMAAKEVEMAAKSAEMAAKEDEQKKLAGQIHLIVLEWLEIKHKPEVEPITYTKNRRAIERDILPHFADFERNKDKKFETLISSRPLRDINKQEMTAIAQNKAKTATDTAYRLINLWNAICEYAEQSGKIELNTAGNLKASKFLPKIQTSSHFASTTNEHTIKEILAFAENYDKSKIIRGALRLLPYIFVRMSNLTEMRWADIDFERKIWRIEKHKTSKRTGAANLPLSDAAIALINEMRPITGHCDYIFPQTNNNKDSTKNFNAPMSNNGVGKAFRDNGFKNIITPHGFRAMFKSIAKQNSHKHGLSSEAIEALLLHKTEKTDVGESYGHLADYTEQMRLLLEWWADFLNSLK